MSGVPLVYQLCGWGVPFIIFNKIFFTYEKVKNNIMQKIWSYMSFPDLSVDWEMSLNFGSTLEVNQTQAEVELFLNSSVCLQS